MDTIPSPDAAVSHTSMDRGKRLASSPALSPSKEPQLKKHQWADRDTDTTHIPALAAVPASDNPVTESMLKSMLLTLQKDLHRELQLSVSQIHDRVDCLEGRAHLLEDSMHDHVRAHNELLDAHEHHASEIHHMKLKLADLEDRSRRNNIKFRGIPESVKSN